MLIVLILASTASVVNCVDLVPPENVWVREGQDNVTLLCRASDRIQACAWITPYGKNYPLMTGLSAESGRLVHFANEKEKECGVRITRIEEKDNGRWRCNVGVVKNNEVTTASGMANITIAVAPEDILLLAPFDTTAVNISAGATSQVSCMVKHARPAPTSFTWMVDEEEITGKVVDEEVFVDTTGISNFKQTLIYSPESDHHNKTLRCVIDHAGLSKQVAAKVIVFLTGTEADYSALGLPEGAGTGICIAAIIFILLSFLLAFYYRKNRAVHKPLAETDAEANGVGNEGTDDDTKKSSEEPTENGAKTNGATELATETDAAIELHTSTGAANNSGSPLQLAASHVVHLFRRLVRMPRTSAAEKSANNLNSTVAVEFEKVDLTDMDEEEEVVDGEKNPAAGEKSDSQPAKEGMRVRIGMLFNRLKRRPEAGKEAAEAEGEEKKDAEKPVEEEEEGAAETGVEEKEVVVPEEGGDLKKRRGSETPV